MWRTVLIPFAMILFLSLPPTSSRSSTVSLFHHPALERWCAFLRPHRKQILGSSSGLTLCQHVTVANERHLIDRRTSFSFYGFANRIAHLFPLIRQARQRPAFSRELMSRKTRMTKFSVRSLSAQCDLKANLLEVGRSMGILRGIIRRNHRNLQRYGKTSSTCHPSHHRSRQPERGHRSLETSSRTRSSRHRADSVRLRKRPCI